MRRDARDHPCRRQAAGVAPGRGEGRREGRHGLGHPQCGPAGRRFLGVQPRGQRSEVDAGTDGAAPELHPALVAVVQLVVVRPQREPGPAFGGVVDRQGVQTRGPLPGKAVAAEPRRLFGHLHDGQIEVGHLGDDHRARGHGSLRGAPRGVFLGPEVPGPLRAVTQLGEASQQLAVEHGRQVVVGGGQRCEGAALRVGTGGQHHGDPGGRARRRHREVAGPGDLDELGSPRQGLGGGDEGEQADQAVLVEVVVRGGPGAPVAIERRQIAEGHVGRQVGRELLRAADTGPVREAQDRPRGGRSVHDDGRRAGQVPVGHVVEVRRARSHPGERRGAASRSGPGRPIPVGAGAAKQPLMRTTPLT